MRKFGCENSARERERKGEGERERERERERFTQPFTHINLNEEWYSPRFSVVVVHSGRGVMIVY